MKTEVKLMLLIEFICRNDAKRRGQRVNQLYSKLIEEKI